MEELLAALEWMVRQHCSEESKNVYFSGYISSNADAMELLVEHKKAVEVGESYGRAMRIKF